MYVIDSLIDGKYRVDSICSDAGGMGIILFVTPLIEKYAFPIVLKYCRSSENAYLERFRREVRLLSTYKGNSKIVHIVDDNLGHTPPYFVMKYYSDGDLGRNAEAIRSSNEKLEICILHMIDALHELHSKSHYHRDIKPQNFLIEGSNIVISDFGLSTEVGSNTALTSSSMFGGTQGYMPPEFFKKGGFKHIQASSDIFMLGKTIYNIATGDNATHIQQGALPAPLFQVIEKCCKTEQSQRYQNILELKQYIVAAFDVILNRGGYLSKVKQLVSSIEDRLKNEQQYDHSQIGEFVKQLYTLDHDEKIRICFELSQTLISVFGQEPVQQYVEEFLSCYEEFVESRAYSWEYAEIIAFNMRVIFASHFTTIHAKSLALDIAIRAAIYMNRFAAMDTCKKMICNVNDKSLGLEVASLINKHRDSFVDGIELFDCRDSQIACAIEANIKLAQEQQPQST